MSEPDLFNSHRPLYGFRFAWLDGLVLILATVAVVMLLPVLGLLAILPLVVLSHFFLFCNVFRVRRNFELIWAVVFMANCSVQIWRFSNGAVFNWWWVLALQSPVTVAFILLELRSRQYHGIGSRRINPHLQAYIEARSATVSESITKTNR